MQVTELRRTHADQLSWPDDRLLSWAASVVAVPKAAPADSFVLHAPLELLARAALLHRVPLGHRTPARERVVGLAATYAAAGEGLPDPVTPDHGSVADGCAALVKAVSAGDLDEVDRHATWLAAAASADGLRTGLGPAVVPLLGAAAHAPILLHLMSRVPALGPGLLRGAVRELARRPDLVVPVDGLAAGDRPLLDALLATPPAGMPDSAFIAPMVRHGRDAAAHLLAGVDPDPGAALRAVSRVAAWAMVQEGPDHVPYGWTHALTIPQAVLSLGVAPRVAVAVAGSQLVGFRSSMGTRHLDPGAPLPATAELGPADLAAAASRHGDAHVVKYTLAALYAADYDPAYRSLYLAAANRLHEWWWARPDDGFFAGATG
jgi:hypothetical protein